MSKVHDALTGVCPVTGEPINFDVGEHIWSGPDGFFTCCPRCTDWDGRSIADMLHDLNEERGKNEGGNDAS